jgi:hypothetical protein
VPDIDGASPVWPPIRFDRIFSTATGNFPAEDARLARQSLNTRFADEPTASQSIPPIGAALSATEQGTVLLPPTI